jgi:hypothetical protein
LQYQVQLFLYFIIYCTVGADLSSSSLITKLQKSCYVLLMGKST